MDVGLSLLPAPLTVPSQRPGVSYGPLNVVPSECTRCGHPTERGNIWNICPSCTAGASRPGAAPTAFNFGPSSVKLKQHPPTRTAACAVCRVALRVPSHYQSAHVLCPPCQVRHAAIDNPRPLDRVWVPRANPYPVVTPIAKSTRAVASTIAYTYPHVPTPSPAPSLQSMGAVNAGGGVHTSVNHARDALRVCMRFGCGARLPAHVCGDMCEACAGAGFTRPPRAVVQQRVFRHETDCTPRPRESHDLAGTSLMPEPVRGATVTTEGEAVDNEMDVDLVYPDEIPVATHGASTTSESKNEESKPIEEEDVEFELVYPEDVAQATRASSSKPRTNLFTPTTLRALFTDGLQTIHGLQDLTTLVDNSSQRRCRTPGCNEALPAQTCMERCVKCSIGDWKRRKLASMSTSELSRRASTSSLTTTTSMEEKEVSTMLDETSDVEDEDGPPSPSSSPKSSGNELTGDDGVRPIPGWDSDLTELSDSESESVSDSDSDPDPKLAKPHGDTTGLTIRIPLLAHRLPPDNSLRKCGNKKCNIALSKDHRWKTCEPCRRAQRTYQRMRLENIRRSVVGIEMLTLPDLPCRRRSRSLSPDMYETDMTLTPETSRPCSARGCRNRIPLPEVCRWKTCTVCRARARREARRKRDALVETQHPWRQPEVIPRFPAYQNRGALLSSFDAQLKGFVEGQIMYLRAKLHESRARDQGEGEPWKPRHAPMIFVFVGEYSAVTGQRGDSERNSHSHARDHSKSPDDPAELETMRQEVLGIVLDLERALRAKFRPGEAFAIDKGGMIMQFACSLELIAPLRPLATPIDPSPGPSSASDTEASARKDRDEDTSREDMATTPQPPANPTAVPLVKTLSGELEAVVVPDESHPFFRGRRTVIRYSMFG